MGHRRCVLWRLVPTRLALLLDVSGAAPTPALFRDHEAPPRPRPSTPPAPATQCDGAAWHRRRLAQLRTACMPGGGSGTAPVPGPARAPRAVERAWDARSTRGGISFSCPCRVMVLRGAAHVRRPLHPRLRAASSTGRRAGRAVKLSGRIERRAGRVAGLGLCSRGRLLGASVPPGRVKARPGCRLRADCLCESLGAVVEGRYSAQGR